MFLWTKKFRRKIFGNTKEEAEKTKVLAANQGLYTQGIVRYEIYFL